LSILEELQEKLKEEQWTRATIENFSIQSLHKLLTEILNQKKENEVIDICLEFLKHSPKSITALYLLGFLAYEMENKENSLYLQQLLDIFKENKKIGNVELLAEKILEKDPNNNHVLQTLLGVYTDLKKDKERLSVLHKLIKIDMKNGQIAQKLAEYYESHPSGDVKDSDKTVSNKTRYYQLALRRYAKTQNTPKIEEVWKKIVPTNLNKINFFLNISMDIADYNLELAINLLLNLLEALESQKMFNEAVFIAKKILVLDADNAKVREKLTSLYKKHYKDQPSLKACLKNSGLENPQIPLEGAIKKFEKEILFHKNRYVSHKTWGIGVIKEIEKDYFILDFDTKKDHKMSYTMALSSLTPLADDHIWVLKKLGKIKDFSSEQDITFLLLTILRSFPGKNLSIDDFKDELVPDIVPIKSWNTWWNKAKEILKEQPFIGSIKEGRPKYFIRSINIRFEEEIIEKFHQSKKFEEKFKYFEKLKKDIADLDEFADEFKEMVAYFESVLELPRFEFDDKVISFILLKKIEKTEPWALTNKEGSVSINDFMDEEKLFHFLTQNHRVEYKKELIQLVLQYHPHYLSLMKEILFQDHSQIADFLMEQLEKNLSQAEIKEIIDQGVHNIFRENPTMTMWFLHYLLSKRNFVQYDFDEDSLYVEVLYRIDTLGKLANQKKFNWFRPFLYTAELKKILSSANDILFSQTQFIDYIKNHPSREYIEKIYQLTKSSLGLIPKKKIELMKAILDKHPDIDDSSQIEEMKVVEINYFANDKIFTTQEGLERQQKRLLELQKERSLNLIELEKAREKGDLRENAEYQAAREKDNLLNAAIIELAEQIHIAQVLDFSDISGERVIPGTKVTLEREGNQETYSILGFWDTQEENKIIAYNSPLAKGIIGLTIEDTVELDLGSKIQIRILAIEPLKKVK
jgi:transcription elongation factor GreA-like protein/transcription elongation GreA/GreB family factor